GTAVLDDSSVVRDADLLVAVDAESRTEGRSQVTRVRVASAVESDWLLDLVTDGIRDSLALVCNPRDERVDAYRRMASAGIVLEGSRARDADPDAISAVLLTAAREKGPRAFAPDDALDRLSTRLAFARTHAPADSGLPVLDAAGLDAALAALC